MARTKGTLRPRPHKPHVPRTKHEAGSGRMPIEKALYEKWWRELRHGDVLPDRFVWKTCTLHLLLKFAHGVTIALPREVATRICDIAWLAFAGSASGWYSLETQLLDQREEEEAEADVSRDVGSTSAMHEDEDPDALNDEEFDAAIDAYYDYSSSPTF
jgi:hypothetical protein